MYDDKVIIEMKQQGKTWPEIGRAFGKSGATVRAYAKRQDWWHKIRDSSKITNRNRMAGIKDEQAVKDKVSIDNDGSIVEEIERLFREPTKPKTPDEFMALHKYDPESFVYVGGESTVWTVTNGEGETFYNVRSKIKVRPLSDNELSLSTFIDLMRKDPEPINIELVGVGTRNLVIGLADLHFGITDFAMFKDKLSEIFDVVANGYDTIVIEQLGDLFHSSQMKESITLRGTILPTVDMVKAWHDAKSFYIALIEHCLKHSNKIQIEHAAGNHSGNLEFAFLDLIKDRYLLINDRVEVNNHNEWRTAYRLGNVGIMLSHGDTVKLAALPGKFADEYRMLWGDTESHEVHTAHRHNKFKEHEVDGVVMRQFPTPKPTDDFEDKWGYSSRKMIELIEYNEDRSKVVYEI